MRVGIVLVILGALTAVALAFIYVVDPQMSWTLPVGASVESEGTDFLFQLMLGLSAAIYIFVQGFLIYFAWVYRRKPEDGPDALGRNLHGDNRLEIAWTVAPAIIVVILTILSFRQLENLRLGETVPGARIIEVEGYQFAWDFSYPATGIKKTNVLVLEEGVPVTLDITGRDVIHSFWVPAFRLKQDATPGFSRKINITPTMTNVEGGYPDGFPLRCAELCGAGHSAMLAQVQVLDSAAYAQWEQDEIANMQAIAESGGQGAVIYQNNGCVGCHQLDAVGAVGAVGPTHNGLGTTAEQRIADPGYTGTATTAEEYIAESIRNPNAYVVPNYAANIMPPYGPDTISDEDLDLLVQFLLEQK